MQNKASWTFDHPDTSEEMTVIYDGELLYSDDEESSESDQTLEDLKEELRDLNSEYEDLMSEAEELKRRADQISDEADELELKIKRREERPKTIRTCVPNIEAARRELRYETGLDFNEIKSSETKL